MSKRFAEYPGDLRGERGRGNIGGRGKGEREVSSTRKG